MKFVDNPELKKEVAKLQYFLQQIQDDVGCLNEAISDHETDDMNVLQTFDKNVFDIRQRLFDAKINLDTIHKKILKHISETLAPDYYMKKALARKKKGSVKGEANLGLFEPSRLDTEVFKHITISRKKDGDEV